MVILLLHRTELQAKQEPTHAQERQVKTGKRDRCRPADQADPRTESPRRLHRTGEGNWNQGAAASANCSDRILRKRFKIDHQSGASPRNDRGVREERSQQR